MTIDVLNLLKIPKHTKETFGFLFFFFQFWWANPVQKGRKERLVVLLFSAGEKMWMEIFHVP